MTVTRTGLARLHLLFKNGEFVSIVQGPVIRWRRCPNAWGDRFGMPRLNDDFEVFSTLGGRVAFACFEYLNVASLHFLATQLYSAKRNQNTISAGSRTPRARRTVPIHANEIIFQQGACLKGLKKKQRCKNHSHVLAPLSRVPRVSRQSTPLIA